MTLYLHDLLDLEELDKMIAEKRVFKQVHPSLPLYILNYTARAQYMNKWSRTERICRGLILEDTTNKVIARGPAKFMNYGDPNAITPDLDCKVRVSQKEDGSLGIGWKYGKHFGVATRGSFMSDQAKHATAKLTATDKWRISYYKSNNQTQIWEIVFPDNRIVLDYGDRDELIPLGKVLNLDGKIYSRALNNALVGEMTFAEALALPIPADQEGYVLDVLDNKTNNVIDHLKLKGEEYKILHGLLTNTNARRIWVQLAARDCHKMIHELAEKRGKSVEKTWATFLGADPEDFKRVKVHEDIEDTLLTNVPDEFYAWVTKKIDSINDTVTDLVAQSITLAGQLSLIDDKRQRFELVKDHVMSTEIIRLVESRDTTPVILKAWKLAYPDGDDTPFRTQED